MDAGTADAPAMVVPAVFIAVLIGALVCTSAFVPLIHVVTAALTTTCATGIMALLLLLSIVGDGQGAHLSWVALSSCLLPAVLLTQDAPLVMRAREFRLMGCEPRVIRISRNRAPPEPMPSALCR